MATKSQTLITATIDGATVGTWDTRAGGESTAAVSKYRPGGGGEVVDAARSTVGDLTITRRFDLARDLELSRSLRTRVGRAKLVVSEQPLDADDIPFGKPEIYTGTLSSVATDDTDSNSDDARVITLVAVVTQVA